MNMPARSLVAAALLAAHLMPPLSAQPATFVNTGNVTAQSGGRREERKPTYPMILPVATPAAPLPPTPVPDKAVKSALASDTLPTQLPEPVAEDIEWTAFAKRKKAAARIYLKPSLFEITPAAELPQENIVLVEPPPASERAPVCYARGEYLLWWLRDAPNPVPLLTTGNPLVDAGAGTLNAPTTRVLFGGQDIDFSMTAGGRLTVGGWFADGVGMEASGFLLENRSRGFAMYSSATGSPLMAIPFLNAAGQERRLLVANPGAPNVPGNIVSPVTGVGAFTVQHDTQFWGAEASVLFNFVRARGFSFDALAGFAFRQLHETYTLNYELAPASVPGSATIGGAARDFFGTTNDFYGGLVGARSSVRYDRLSLDVTGKVGIGTNRQKLEVNGGSAFTGAAGPPFHPTASYGVFAQRSNIGTFNEQRFTLVPEVSAQLGFDVTRCVKIFGGYNFLYWTDAIRPGNQIDRTLNTTANGDFFTGLQRGVPPLGGRPAPLFNTSDFWAHGVTGGIEFKY